jgi:hypothetical protein
MKNVGIIDADLLDNKISHSFPNLACMKLSGHHKEQGDRVSLLLNYSQIDKYDKVYISKVFTETVIPQSNVLIPSPIERPNVEYGGTGFFFDKAPNLPDEIEHHMPDYNLYNDWLGNQKNPIGKKLGEKRVGRGSWDYYTDYSIGFMTRGCFRKCPFCVNQKYRKVEFHTHVKEFFVPARRAISLWDDNILGYAHWKDVFDELIATGRSFQFKQGMDIRMLTDEKAKVITSCKYEGHYIFAFDDIREREIIEKKLLLWRKYVSPRHETKLFVLCGFDEEGKYDEAFWKKDIENTFERVHIIMKYGCLPFLMRYKNAKTGPYRKLYSHMDEWINSVLNFAKKSFRQFCERPSMKDTNKNRWRNLDDIEKRFPDIAKKYFDLRLEEEVMDKNWRSSTMEKADDISNLRQI